MVLIMIWAGVFVYRYIYFGNVILVAIFCVCLIKYNPCFIDFILLYCISQLENIEYFFHSAHFQRKRKCIQLT